MTAALFAIAALLPAVAEVHTGPTALEAGAPPLRASFTASVPANMTLYIRQRDVRSDRWNVVVNGRQVGTLEADERDLRTALPLPADLVRAGDNIVEISGANVPVPERIEVRQIRVMDTAAARAASIRVEARADRSALPLKISITDRDGALMRFTPLRRDASEAVRTGAVYTPDGRTEIAVPPGEYAVYASRGFEYSSDVQRVNVRSGDQRAVRLDIRRELRLDGYASCDPHVHTLELSGHGDATVAERVVTAAAEGLDMIVAAEHNRVADYTEAARRAGIDRFVRFIPGNEVTTAMGHFVVFPASPAAPVPDSRPPSWEALRESLRGAQVVIQNHPRDVHSGYRPFDAANHLASAGENTAGRPFFAHAVEVVNSSAMFAEPLRLVHDWLGLLNRGHCAAAVGSSDTHTVDVYPIGQARTYVREGSLERFAAGETLVAYGAAARLRVLRSEWSGRTQTITAEVAVLAPSWSRADRVVIFANGTPAAEFRLPRGSVWRKRVALSVRRHDVTLVAVASGPGVHLPFWEVRKPYQRGDKPVARVLGVSEAVRVDVDGTGFKTPADYAEEIVASGNLSRLWLFDEAVAVQVLRILASSGRDPASLRAEFERAGPAAHRGWQTFAAEWEQLKR